MKPGDRVYVAAGVDLNDQSGKLRSSYVVVAPMTLVRLDEDVAHLLPPPEWLDRMGWPPAHLTHPKFLFADVKLANSKALEMLSAARAKGAPLYCSLLPEPPA